MSEIDNKMNIPEAPIPGNHHLDASRVLTSPDFESFVYRAAYTVEKNGYLSCAEFFKSLSMKELHSLSKMCTRISSHVTGRVELKPEDVLSYLYAVGNIKAFILMLALGSGESVLKDSDFEKMLVIVMRMATAMIVELKKTGVVHYEKFDILGDPYAATYTLHNPSDESSIEGGT